MGRGAGVGVDYARDELRGGRGTLCKRVWGWVGVRNLERSVVR
jgi:hypothetical protein